MSITESTPVCKVNGVLIGARVREIDEFFIFSSPHDRNENATIFLSGLETEKDVTCYLKCGRNGFISTFRFVTTIFKVVAK